MTNTSRFRPAARRSLGLLTLLGATLSPTHAQMVTGEGMSGYAQTFGLAAGAPAYEAHYLGGDAPGNILWPGERPAFRFQLVNNGDQPLKATGKVDVIAYGTSGSPGDVWTPNVHKFADAGSVPVTVEIPAHGAQDLTITPDIPARFGGYALVVDLGPQGRRFLTTCVRTFQTDSRTIQYPHFCLDGDLPLDLLQRLGVHVVRWGVGYKPTTAPDFEKWYADQKRQLDDFRRHGITVLFMVGGGDFNGPTQPLGRPRPWLDDKGVMQDTKFDLAWLPSYDSDFQKFCRRFAAEAAWPKGPITGFSLWNEPWEGISISGWGADMLRYREMYDRMWQGVQEGNKIGGNRALVGGGDSSSNALDKLFSDGSRSYLPKFQFLSIHYQGLSSTANLKLWHARKPERVQIWDTESWVANTDDRVAAVVAGNRAAGYDRAMGIFGGNIGGTQSYQARQPDGTTRWVNPPEAWSTAAAVGAVTHFIGERPFRRFLFQNGLPWVMLFDGETGHPDDGTAVVVGDLGEEFGHDGLPFRTARGFAERKHQAELKAQLAALPATATLAERQKIQDQIGAAETLSGATLTLAADPKFSLYDPYGNPVPAEGGKIVVPLDGRGFFLRADGSPGSFARLTDALKAARIDGIEPVALAAHDFPAPLQPGSRLRLTLTNVLNRPISGTLAVALGRLTVGNAGAVSLAPNETRTVELPVTGEAASDNAYPLSVTFDGGPDGRAVLTDTLHANVIHRRTVKIDGKLEDWAGTLPQTIQAQGAGELTLTQKAWLPFQSFDSSVKSGLASAYLAYDAQNFYFADKVADATPDPGMVRFATEDPDEYFYPKTSYTKDAGKTFSIRWSGTVTPKYSEVYTFTTTSDDGVRLWVNGKQIINNWTDHGPTDDSGTITLEAGKPVSIKMELYNSSGGTTARLAWQSLSQPKEVVPTEALAPSEGTGHGLTGQYFPGVELAGEPKVTRLDGRIDFAWGDGEVPDPKMSSQTLLPLTWPDAVRRYSYRKNPELPAGDAPSHDNVLIGFNVLPDSQKPYDRAIPGVMPGYLTTQDTDYEFALNPVAARYGGGTEIWRLQTPKIPRKHFYPRQPKSPGDGPVQGGKLVISRDGGTLLYECAIPWAEMPEVKARLDAGQTVKFSYRVNDNAGGPTMELAKGRSVSRRNGSFHVDWDEHWANELEFGAGK